MTTMWARAAPGTNSATRPIAPSSATPAAAAMTIARSVATAWATNSAGRWCGRDRTVQLLAARGNDGRAGTRVGDVVISSLQRAGDGELAIARDRQHRAARRAHDALRDAAEEPQLAAGTGAADDDQPGT